MVKAIAKVFGKRTYKLLPVDVRAEVSKEKMVNHRLTLIKVFKDVHESLESLRGGTTTHKRLTKRVDAIKAEIDKTEEAIEKMDAVIVEAKAIKVLTKSNTGSFDDTDIMNELKAIEKVFDELGA